MGRLLPRNRDWIEYSPNPGQESTDIIPMGLKSGSKVAKGRRRW